MDYKKTAPNIPAESGSGTIRTSRNYKDNAFRHEKQAVRAGAMMQEPALPILLRDMKLERALAQCVAITSKVWDGLEGLLIIELWRIIRTYLLSRNDQTDLVVPVEFADTWRRCKVLIDEEIGK